MIPNHLPIFDADNHFYETRDAITRHLADRYRNVIRYAEVDGRLKLLIAGKIADSYPHPSFDVVARPGAQEDFYRRGNPEGKSFRDIFGEPMHAIDAFREPAARLALLDEQGVERTMMYPTLASLLEERLADDPEATHAVIHSLNEWIHETWTFNYQDRIFTTPVITPPIVEEAVRELEWCVERGAKAILMRPAPAPGYKGRRSFALPEYDPFWSRVVEHDVLVVLHSSDSGYDRYVNEWSGRDQEMMPFAGDVFPMVSQWRPIEDAVASLVIHGALSRFPELKIAVVENGSSWLRPLMETMENQYKKWPQQFMEHPIDVLRRNIHISPFWEEDLGRVADLLGKDRVLFGSDYPHPEGLAEPRSYVNEVAHLPEPLQRKILRENIARLMGVDLRASTATTA